MTFGLCFHFQFGIRCNMIIYAFTAVGALYLVKLFFTPEPEPIAGVYKVPGARYNVKYCFFRLILWLRQRKNKKLESTSGQNAGYGVRSRSSPEDMDKAQDLPNVNEHPKVKTPPTLTSAKTVKTNLNSVPVFHGIYFIYCHLYSLKFYFYYNESKYFIPLKNHLKVGWIYMGFYSELVCLLGRGGALKTCLAAGRSVSCLGGL